MSASRRPAFLPALAILLLAGLTSACGVKGDLERPAAAPADAVSAAPQPAPEAVPEESGRKSVFVERSRVQSRAHNDILPKMPPKEWEKKKIEEEERKAITVGPRKPNPNDRPFILDGLL